MKLADSIASVVFRTESGSVALVSGYLKGYGCSLCSGNALNVHTSHSCSIVHKQGRGFDIWGQKNVLLNESSP